MIFTMEGADKMQNFTDTDFSQDDRPSNEMHARTPSPAERSHGANAISSWFEYYETFRELCEEYEACNEALERLATAEANAAAIREYSELRLRLKSELQRHISEHRSIL